MLNAVHDVFLLMADVRFAYERAGGVGRLGRGVRRRERPDAGVLAARDGAAGQRVSANGRTRSSAWRATPGSTSCAWASIDGRWRRRWSSSRPSGGCGRCDEQDQGFSNRCSLSAAVIVGLRPAALPSTRKRPRPRRRRPRPDRRLSRRSGAPPPPRQHSRPPACASRREAGEVESDPIRCWWKTDRTAVRVGERFGLTLTCGVIETRADHGRARRSISSSGALSADAVRSGERRAPRGRRGAAVALLPVRVRGAAAERRLLRPGRQPAGADRHLQHAGAAGRRRRAATRATSCRRCRCACCRSCRGAPPTSATPRGQTFAIDRVAAVPCRRSRPATAWIALRVRRRCLASSRSCASPAQFRRAEPRRVQAAARLVAAACVPAALARVKDDAAQAGWTAELCAPGAAGAAHRRRIGARPPGRAERRRAGRASARGSCRVRTGWLRRRRVAALGVHDSAHDRPRALSNGHGPQRAARASLESISDGAAGVWLRPPTAGTSRSTDCIALDSALGREHAGRCAAFAASALVAACARSQALRSFVTGCVMPVPLTRPAPVALRTTLDEWMRTRWSDLQFAEARTALLVFVVLLAVVVLLLVLRTARQRGPADARGAAGHGAGDAPVAAVVVRHVPLVLFLAGVPLFAWRWPTRDRLHARGGVVSGPPHRAAGRRLHQHGDEVRVHG